MASAPPHNRLDRERSAYLRAHSADPVDWRPWGTKAFDLARRHDRPVFLSIGYQSCHWCHVMQRESFRNVDTAHILNSAFVPVKVDREIRPDIDALYIAYVATSTGSAGWPLSVFVTPDGLPFLGGTYFPAQSTDPRATTFPDLLDIVQRAWVLDRERAIGIAEDAIAVLRADQVSGHGPITRETIDRAASLVLAREDVGRGGFGSAPKFPQAPATTFLLAYHQLTGDVNALEAASRTIHALIRGGIFDQVEGGLFRYSTDADWLVPHFEKMLYDSAQLLSSIASLYALDPDPELARAARLTTRFLTDRLARPEGGFYSSLDAETEGIEGATYAWTFDELADALSPSDLTLAEECLGVTREGNWHDGLNVLARRSGRPCAERVDRVLDVLREHRASRPQPGLVDNAIVSWNALAARGLIEAGAALGDDTVLDAGLKTLDWLLDDAVWHDDVLHAIGDASVAKVRFSEDAAAVAAACLSAADLADRPRARKIAERVHRGAVERFGTEAGFVMSAGETNLPFTPLERSDDPAPSGAALLAENALRLSAQDGEGDHLRTVERALAQFSRTAEALPYLAGHALAVAAKREFMRR